MRSSDGFLILTVDNDSVNRKVIERILVDAGFRVLCADSGPNALNLLSEATPDLILLDVMMPGMDGYEVCAKLQGQAKHGSIPVIFLTALGEKQDRARVFLWARSITSPSRFKSPSCWQKLPSSLKPANVGKHYRRAVAR